MKVVMNMTDGTVSHRGPFKNVCLVTGELQCDGTIIATFDRDSGDWWSPDTGSDTCDIAMITILP